MLSGLVALLPRLVALLTFLLHIVSHKTFLLKKRETPHAFEFVATYNLVAVGDCKGWDRFSCS
jgi:hypothetical protein